MKTKKQIERKIKIIKDGTYKDVTEFNLSDKINSKISNVSGKGDLLWTKDVKEFIARLKEEINKFGIHKTGVHRGFLCHKIDKLAGSELVGKPIVNLKKLNLQEVD